MQLTAREWIELIADPEKKKTVKGWVKEYPLIPDALCNSIYQAIGAAIAASSMPYDLQVEWANMVNNPPELLPFPFPNKEREQAEALLNEFAEFWNKGTAPANEDYMDAQWIADFLNQKYPS